MPLTNGRPYLIPASKMEMIDSSGRETMGGLDWIVVLALMAAGVLSAFSPWSFFIGGRFTPLAQWTGYGKLHSANGAEYGLFLRLAHHQSDDVASTFETTPNLRGSAIVCTPQGERYEYRLEGTVRNAWLQTDGRATGLKLLAPDRQPQLRTLGLTGNDLHGVWHQGRLVLEESSLSTQAHVAKPKSRHARRRVDRSSENAPTVVSYGDLSSFDDFCRNQIVSRQARLVKPSPALRVSSKGD